MTKAKADRAYHAAIARLTGGLSPTALATAYLDWSMHLLGSPDKLIELWTQTRKGSPIAREDTRFDDPGWGRFPYKLWRDGFLAQQAWWDRATSDVKGVDPKHLNIVNFTTRQMLDMMSPTNFALTNPKVIARTQSERGLNLLRGMQNWVEDFNHLVSGTTRRSKDFIVGDNIAVTPGEVVFRNRLIELLHYPPTGPARVAEPVLITPAWIMKYYVLDLSQQNSVVKYLCDEGFEVYMISWKNPDAADADLGMQDYVDLGIRAAIDVVQQHGHERLHAVGYCLGGTLLAITAAAMARDGDPRFQSITFLASQVDFAEPGELGLYINESQVAFLEDLMEQQGFLKAGQMSGAFRLLRSNDLIWSRVIRHYLLGERTEMNDLMAWNADSTRMPAKMHSEYLRHLFLKNELSKGRYKVDGRPVALSDIKKPIFCLATETDHISPWQSVYRMLLLTDTDVDFVLTNGGHNGGVLSYPTHPRRHFRHSLKVEGDKHVSAPHWFVSTQPQQGSWWPLWTRWLKEKSEAKASPCSRSAKVASLAKAPGTYVFG